MDKPKPPLPGRLSELPYFEASRTAPKSRAQSARQDVIYGADSLSSLLKGVRDKLGGGKPTPS